MNAARPNNPIKVFFVCTGVGIGNRGIESFFRDAFDGLHDLEEFDMTLYKGRGPEFPNERLLWCLPKTGRLARFLGWCTRRHPYVIEQHAALLPLMRQIRQHRPRLIFTSDPVLLRRLFFFRKIIGVDFRLLFSNGFPMEKPLWYVDHTQQVAPYYYDLALELGGSPDRMTLAPYGINVPENPPAFDASERRRIRQQLGLPQDRPIILSVGWISKELKRMDYTVDEIASLPEPRPFLVMLGSIDHTSAPIIEQARQKLGEGNFIAKSVPYAEVAAYYRAADIFALASIREGFGRVYIEALMQGLPCVVNDHAVTRYVLGPEGTYADLTKPGALAAELPALLARPLDSPAMLRRWEFVRDKFGWKALRKPYSAMFHKALDHPPLGRG